jgi:hypothetical protein
MLLFISHMEAEMGLFLIAEIKDMAGAQVAVLSLPEKEFKTGSKGYFATGKATIGEKRYQVQVQMVEIGSKSKPEE